MCVPKVAVQPFGAPRRVWGVRIEAAESARADHAKVAAMAVTPEEAFDELYLAAGARLVGQLYAATGDLGEAQDCVQDAFVRAWLRWDRVAGYDNAEAWVRRVALNLAVSRWRRARRLVLGRSVDVAQPAPGREQADVVAALRTLPERQRTALVLHDLAGLTVAEVATELRVPEGTVKSWLSRSRAQLARELGGEEDA
jgi:RNA polymerase sigma-70 factor (ECF subfamily)